MTGGLLRAKVPFIVRVRVNKRFSYKRIKNHIAGNFRKARTLDESSEIADDAT